MKKSLHKAMQIISSLRVCLAEGKHQAQPMFAFE